ncbi:hypothetical protein Dimus_034170 [Dionaea muscipula]
MRRCFAYAWMRGQKGEHVRSTARRYPRLGCPRDVVGFTACTEIGAHSWTLPTQLHASWRHGLLALCMGCPQLFVEHVVTACRPLTSFKQAGALILSQLAATFMHVDVVRCSLHTLFHTWSCSHGKLAAGRTTTMRCRWPRHGIASRSGYRQPYYPSPRAHISGCSCSHKTLPPRWLLLVKLVLHWPEVLSLKAIARHMSLPLATSLRCSPTAAARVGRSCSLHVSAARQLPLLAVSCWRCSLLAA